MPHTELFRLNKIKHNLLKCNICKEAIPYVKLNNHVITKQDGSCPYEYCNNTAAYFSGVNSAPRAIENKKFLINTLQKSIQLKMVHIRVTSLVQS